MLATADQPTMRMDFRTCRCELSCSLSQLPVDVAPFPSVPFIAKLARGRKNNRFHLLELNQASPQGVHQLGHGMHL